MVSRTDPRTQFSPLVAGFDVNIRMFCLFTNADADGCSPIPTFCHLFFPSSFTDINVTCRPAHPIARPPIQRFWRACRVLGASTKNVRAAADYVKYCVKLFTPDEVMKRQPFGRRSVFPDEAPSGSEEAGGIHEDPAQVVSEYWALEPNSPADLVSKSPANPAMMSTSLAEPASMPHLNATSSTCTTTGQVERSRSVSCYIKRKSPQASISRPHRFCKATHDYAANINLNEIDLLENFE